MINTNIKKDELNIYKNWVESGKFYENLSIKVGSDISTKSKRREFKEQIFTNLFFAKNKNFKTKYETAFEALFPVIYECIINIRKQDNTLFANMLTKIESDFIFKLVDKIGKNLEIPLITIHDSICSTQKEIKKIKYLMEQDGKIRPGLNIPIEIKEF